MLVYFIEECSSESRTLYPNKMCTNRPFPSCLVPLFQICPRVKPFTSLIRMEMKRVWFAWKWNTFSYEWFRPKARFDIEAKHNSDISHWNFFGVRCEMDQEAWRVRRIEPSNTAKFSFKLSHALMCYTSNFKEFLRVLLPVLHFAETSCAKNTRVQPCWGISVQLENNETSCAIYWKKMLPNIKALI